LTHELKKRIIINLGPGFTLKKVNYTIHKTISCRKSLWILTQVPWNIAVAPTDSIKYFTPLWEYPR
jgi:hypothetical protein